MKIFNLKNNVSVVCNYAKTRNGFKHTASLMVNGLMRESVKICHLNRTWESFEYELVLYKLIDKTGILTPEEKAEFFAKESGTYKEEVNKNFGMIAGIMALGGLLTDNQKEANDWKARMLKAGLGNSGLIMPEDWDTLSEDEKTRRLSLVQKELSHV